MTRVAEFPSRAPSDDDYVVVLTPTQRHALIHMISFLIVGEPLGRQSTFEVFVDPRRGIEVRPGELLELVLGAVTLKELEP